MHCLLSCVMAAAPVCARTVTVDATAGAPRILVDGRPVRSRMFFGGFRGTPIPVEPGEREISFDFTALESEPATATMHFRLGMAPGEVLFDDIHVVDLDTGDDVIPVQTFESGDAFAAHWLYWPSDGDNTVATVTVDDAAGKDNSGALRVSLREPPGGDWPDWHFFHRPVLELTEGHRYRASFWVSSDAERDLRIGFYRPGQSYTYLGGPPGLFGAQVKLAADVGVDFVSFPLGLPWPAPGQDVDWAGVDANCLRVLEANPRALLIPRLWMGPPGWWFDAHPEDRMVWEDGPRQNGFVVASPAYRRDAGERLVALVEHLEARFPENMAGYHPCGQNTGEWFYRDTWLGQFSGYSEGSLAAFRVWLAERYTSDAALRAAWNDPAVTLATADVPDAAGRHASPVGMLRDPVAERPVLDFAEFQQQAMADCVCEFAHGVREASNGEKLVVFFYGYVFEFAALGTNPAMSGHYALRRVLDCPDIDVLCSPISYHDRGPGGSSPSMTAAESVALAGKLWLNEDDTATHLSSGTFPGHQFKAETLEETNTQLVRNTAQEALRNFGTWWMDLGATGWFNDPDIWAEMERLRALDEALLATPTPYRPPIAAVVDERSMLRVADPGHTLTRPLIYEGRGVLAKAGASYGQYLLDDVLAGRVDAEVYLFLSAWRLDENDRRALRERTRGKTRVWCYAPGYHDGYITALGAMRQVTGFSLAYASIANAKATPTDVGRGRGIIDALGADAPIRPLFTATDATADETLATYSDGSTAIAMRRGDEGVDVFIGPPALSTQLLRAIYREAGVHIFTETDCNVYANDPYVVLHAAHPGPVGLDTGREGAIVDMLTGDTVGAGPRLTLELAAAETRVLKY